MKLKKNICIYWLLFSFNIDKNLIFGNCFQLLERRAALMEKSDVRRAKLEDSYRLQQFERDCDETKGWVSEKLKTAMDESYLVIIFSLKIFSLAWNINYFVTIIL